MHGFIVPIWCVALIFAGVAFFYASVGLGGGSSYTALMAVFGAGVEVIPILSLTLNVLVSSIGSLLFLRNRHLRLRLLIPFLVSSVPMAYLGGKVHLPKRWFYGLLLASLLFAAVRIYFFPGEIDRVSWEPRRRISISLVSGGILGFLAGAVGIGGGIYLVPLIMLLGLGTTKEAAACGAVFIWVNSISGLLARFRFHPIDMMHYLPVILAVLAGGSAGAFLGAGKFSPRKMQQILGMILIFAVLLLARKIFVLSS